MKAPNALASDPNSTYEFWSSREHIFGQMVVAGLAVETLLVFWLPDPWWIKGTSLGSDLLVVLGVWGEIWAGNRAAQAGNAIVQKARADAAQANAVAEQTRLERIKLEERFAPRSLSLSQRQAISNRLREYSEIHADIMSYGRGFPEVMRVSATLVDVMHCAGWQAGLLPPPPPNSWLSVEGILIVRMADASENMRNASFVLAQALNEVGWVTGERQGDEMFEMPFVPNAIIDPRRFSRLRILVGFKPQ